MGIAKVFHNDSYIDGRACVINMQDRSCSYMLIRYSKDRFNIWDCGVWEPLDISNHSDLETTISNAINRNIAVTTGKLKMRFCDD